MKSSAMVGRIVIGLLGPINIPERRNGWLGREESNLGMMELNPPIAATTRPELWQQTSDMWYEAWYEKWLILLVARDRYRFSPHGPNLDISSDRPPKFPETCRMAGSNRGVPVGNSILLATDIELGDAPALCERFVA